MYMRSVRKGRKFLCSCFRYGWMLLLPAMSVTPALGCGAATDCNVQDNRHYRIHMLDGATGALVFAHGFGGSTKGTIDNSGLLRIAESHGLSLVALKSAAKDWSIANAPSKVTQTGIDEVGYVDGDGGAKLGHWSGGTVSPHRRCKTLPVVRLGPFDFGGALPGDVFCGGLQRGSSFRIH